MDKLRQLVRTYPQATAGTPTEHRVRRHHRPLLDDLPPDPSITQPTQIFVSPLTSPHGYDVEVTGGTATKNGSIVLVKATLARPVHGADHPPTGA